MDVLSTNNVNLYKVYMLLVKHLEALAKGPAGLLTVIGIDDHAQRKAIVCDAVTRLITTSAGDTAGPSARTRRANVHPPNTLP